MAKDSYYFPHDSNARNDIKLVKVRRKYKMIGYGAYFAIIEILREQTGYKLPIADIDDIAYELEVRSEIIRSIIEDFALFTIDDGYFFSPSLLVRMERYDTLKTKRKEAGKIGGNASVKKKSTIAKTNTKQSSTIAQAIVNDFQPLEESKGEYSRVKESKGEEKKGDEKKRTRPLEILFRDSEFFDLQKFKNEFIGTKYEIYNLEFYYESVLNWSNSKNAKKIDWIATARNFMIGDSKNGKAALSGQNLTQNVNRTARNNPERYSDIERELERRMGGTSSVS